MDTDTIIPTGITIGLTMGITAVHTTGLTGIEGITTTIIIIITITIGGIRGTKGTRTNNKALTVSAMRVSNEASLFATRRALTFQMRTQQSDERGQGP
jgi:hypothetical protein